MITPKKLKVHRDTLQGQPAEAPLENKIPNYSREFWKKLKDFERFWNVSKDSKRFWKIPKDLKLLQKQEQSRNYNQVTNSPKANDWRALPPKRNLKIWGTRIAWMLKKLLDWL